jgi:L-ascorbate metabolism protein UlaG (beta-lactamase superfamily)
MHEMHYASPTDRWTGSAMKRRMLPLVWFVAAVLALALGVGLALAWKPMGQSPSGQRLERLRRSPNYARGRFQNQVAVRPYSFASIWGMLGDYAGGQERTPAAAVPVEVRHAGDYATPPSSGLRVTWLGHSSVLVEIDGVVVLTDPIFSERLSPLGFIGPKRFFPSPLSVDELPPIDAVVISHDHYDHLDQASVIELLPRVRRFVMPLGVGSHLAYWGIPDERIVELDWWEETRIGDALRLIACPARHFSGRGFSGDQTEWASFAMVGPGHRVFFSGDTGLMPQFEQVGHRFGPFDLSLVKIGAYGRGWPDIHVDPEQALELYRMIQGKLLMPIHWGTVNLSYHSWTEPAERLIVAAEHTRAKIVIPRPGALVEPAEPPQVERWWPDVRWQPCSVR